MAEATLAIRPHEHKQYWNGPNAPDMADANVYAVALMPSLPFPGDNHEQSVPLAVICAQRYVTQVSPGHLWGWVLLMGETKEEVGRDLEAMRDDGKYQVGEWAYLYLKNGEPGTP